VLSGAVSSAYSMTFELPLQEAAVIFIIGSAHSLFPSDPALKAALQKAVGNRRMQEAALDVALSNAPHLTSQNPEPLRRRRQLASGACRGGGARRRDQQHTLHGF